MTDSTPYLDLRIRVFNDNGPLYRALSEVGKGAPRNMRAANLMYLGLVIEAGRIDEVASVRPVPAATIQVASPSLPKPVIAAASPDVGLPDVDDALEIFGMGPDSFGG